MSEPSAPRDPDPMAELQRTIGAPSASETDLFAPQQLAQQVGGLHPSTYNWLAFGRAPSAEINSSATSLPSAIESGTDDAPDHTADRDPGPTSRQNSRSRNHKKRLRRAETC